nr:hypothetical protein [Tanacetum cinerariifolium]
MITFLTKSDASECFKQITDFLNANVIQYALVTNDVVRLQALIDRRKVIITEDTVRQALHLDDADSIDCLSNEEIFIELARMGYEKPSKKMTFYKAFFSARLKFPIHTILQCMSAKRTTWNEFSSSMASADKIVQALDITKLKQRARRLEKKSKLKASRKMHLNKGKIAKIDANEDVTLEEVDAEKDAEVQGRLEESQAQVYHLDLEHAQKVLKVVTTAKLMTKVVTATAATTAATTIIVALMPTTSAPRIRKSVVIRDPEEIATPLVKRSEKQDNTVMRYQALKRKPQTKAQARKNMMVYLKNMAGFKMDFFKGMTYDEIRPFFEMHFNFIVAFLEKGEKELEEEVSKVIKRKSETSEEKAAKKQKLDEEVEELKTHLQIIPIDEDDVYT